MAFTEFFCDPVNGDNLNAGTLDGTTGPAATPVAVFTGGDWSGSINFTLPVGADATEVVIGRFASVCHDGDTTPTLNQFLVGRISAYNSGTRQVSIIAVSQSRLGTVPAAGTGNRTLRIGGRWRGPNGAEAFPFGFVAAAMTNNAGNAPRVNLKAGTAYAITAAMTHSLAGPVVFQGYTTTPGDGGQATVSGPGTGASFVLLTLTGGNLTLRDLIFDATGFVSGTSAGVSLSTSAGLAERCVVIGSRANGFVTGVSSVRLVECETYSFGAAANSFGFDLNNGGSCVRCIAHDAAVVGNGGFRLGGAASASGCIADTLTGVGFNFSQASGGTVRNCVAYNCSSHGVSVTAAGLAVVENCLLVSNGGYGVSAGSTVPPRLICNAFYGNTSGLTMGAVDESGSVTLTADPFMAAATGDFRLNATTGGGVAAKAAGRGSFLQTQTGYTGTVGYPDIGTAQSTGGTPGEVDDVTGAAIISGVLAGRVKLDATQPDYAPAKASDVPTVAANAAAVRTNLATELGRLDVPVSDAYTEAQAAEDVTNVLAAITAVPGLVWVSGTRTLTSFGTLVADVTAGSGLTEDEHAKVMLIGTEGALVRSPFVLGYQLDLVRGDSYDVADGRAIDFPGGGDWPDLTGLVPTFKAKHKDRADLIEGSLSVLAPTGDSQAVRLQLSSTQTSVAPGTYYYDVQVKPAGSRTVTLVRRSPLILTEDVDRT